MKRKIDFNTGLSLFLVIGMMVALAITVSLKLHNPDTDRLMLAVASFAAMLGIINTVLSANAHIWTFFFGLVDVSLMAWVYWDSGAIGNCLLHALYFVPMQFIGFWQWKRRGAGMKTAEDGSRAVAKVHARRLGGKGKLFLLALWVGGTALLYLVISHWGTQLFGESSKPYLLDATLMASNILGQVLMSLAYVEQWYLWNLVNVCNISLFSYLLLTGGAKGSGVVMLLKYSFYLINSLNGLRIWLKISRKEEEIAR